ncbi:MAG: hypothetical protein Q7S40_25940 [Opitutaceae bacterium]|nr:hypothetical protein [Opitutaceae bacterium]
MRRIAVIFAGQLLLWLIMAELNHLLTGTRVYLFVAALYVVHGAMLQPWRAGFTASLLAGLLCDSTSPVVFGTHLVLFAAAHVAVFHLRDRLPREDVAGNVVVMLLVNLGLFIVFSFTQVHHSPAPGAAWLRLAVDLLCSQVFIALVTPWFFALQARALVLAQVERENFA